MIALRSSEGRLDEPDLDWALRVVAGLGGSLTVLDAAAAGTLADVLRGPSPPDAGPDGDYSVGLGGRAIA